MSYIRVSLVENKKVTDDGVIDLKDSKLTIEKVKEQLKFMIESEDKTEFSFGTTIEMLKNGFKMGRKGWNGKGMWLEIQFPADDSKMTRPYLYHVSKKGSTNHYGPDVKDIERTPWLPSNSDILAEDWVIVENNVVLCKYRTW